MRTSDSTRRTVTLRVTILHVLLLSAMGLPLAGCKEKKPVEPVEVAPQKSPEELAAEAERVRLEGIKKKFKTAQELIRLHPDDWAQHLENLNGRLYEAEGTSLEKEIRAEVEKMQQSRENFAKKKLDQIFARAKALVDDEQDHLAAYELLETFDPEGLLAETKAYLEYEEKKEWVQREEDAGVEFKRVTQLARSLHRTKVLEEVAKAIGVLESYPDEFKDTVYFPQVRELVDEYFETYKTLRAEEEAIVNVVEENIEIDEYMGNFITLGEGVWTAEGGVASGENGTNGPAIFRIGDEKWNSYQVRMTIKAPAGQVLRIAGTARVFGRSGERQFAFYKVDLESSDWIEVMVVFRDGLLTIQNLTTQEELLDPLKPREPPAGVAIGLSPGDEVQIKDVKVKVFSRAEDEAVEPPEDEGR